VKTMNVLCHCAQDIIDRGLGWGHARDWTGHALTLETYQRSDWSEKGRDESGQDVSMI